jgi:hypothetical protein
MGLYLVKVNCIFDDYTLIIMPLINKGRHRSVILGKARNQEDNGHPDANFNDK